MKPYGIAGDILDKLEAALRSEDTSTESRKAATLTFQRDALLYDIRNIAYVEGDVHQTEDEHARHQIIDIGEDGNVDRVTRIMDLAFAHCREVLYPYSKKSAEAGVTLGDAFGETGTYVIELSTPDDFSQTTLDYLEKLIHEFVVYRVLADWMSITNADKSSAAQWAAKAAELEDGIESALHARMKRVRRTQTPF